MPSPSSLSPAAPRILCARALSLERDLCAISRSLARARSLFYSRTHETHALKGAAQLVAAVTDLPLLRSQSSALPATAVAAPVTAAASRPCLAPAPPRCRGRALPAAAVAAPATAAGYCVVGRRGRRCREQTPLAAPPAIKALLGFSV
jgi:hypothetical protein